MSNCQVYSYYCNDQREFLRDHITTALSLINKGSRLIRYGLKIDPNVLMKVRLSIIFHDIGKALFQKPRIKTSCISFRGHEYISTLILDDLRKQLIKLNVDFVDNNDLMEIAYAVLYHHHAIGIRRRQPIIGNYDLSVGLKCLHATKAFIEEILKDETEIAKAYEIAIKKLIEKITILNNPQRIEQEIERAIEEIKNDIRRRYIEKKGFRKRANLILVSLLTVDYIASQRYRKPTKSLFSDVVGEFHRLYLKNI